MAWVDDDQLNKNAALFISVREKTSVQEKKDHIMKCLQQGADINAADGNNSNNAPLHDAVRRSEAEIVKLLLEKGANLNLKNVKGETPLLIALSLNSDNKQEIVTLLQNADKSNNVQTAETPNNEKPTSEQTKKAPTNSKKQKVFTYLKRTGTSGVSGQLYETKLLSLVLVKALNDEEIELFHLGTNINGIGDLDDICLRFKVRGNLTPILVFMQAKHKENGKITVEDVRSAKGDFSLRKYFDSYLTIKDRFQPSNKDVMFDGEFDSVDCNFIIYTPATDSFAKKKTDTQINKKVHNLIDTGTKTEVFQINHDKVSEEIDILTNMTVIDRIKKLGSLFLQFILAKSDKTEVFKTTKLITRYHVIMGREILQLLKFQEPITKHRMWQFNPDFFISDCQYLVAIKTTFYNDLATTRCDNTKIVNADKYNFIQIIENPCASTISKLIGKVVKYNSKTLEIIEVKDFKKLFDAQEYEALVEKLNIIQVNETTIKEAVRLKLESITFALPLWFGNLDMTLKDAKRETTLAAGLIKLIKLNENDNIIEINDDMVGPGKIIEKGIIDINGGLASAVGNLLVFDIDTKMMMLDVDNESLPDKAASFLKELSKKEYKPYNQKLSSYRFKFNIDGFPKDSFNGDEFDKKQAKDFLSKLWFYPNQAKESEVERIVKNNINKYYKEKDQNQFQFRIHSDAIFLRSHDEIQKWWLQTGDAPYLNESSELFERAKLAVIDSPLLTVFHFMYNLKLQNINIKFKEDVINALELNTISKRVYNVITDANILSGIKIMQYFESRDNYTFIDFDYVLSLPLNDYNTMLQELKQTNIDTLVLIYEKLKYYEGFCNKLKEVITYFKGSRLVILTESILAAEIKKYVGDNYQSVRDDRTYMDDLAESSQLKILDEVKISFQGVEMPFKNIQYDTKNLKSQNFVRTEILYKLIYGTKIEIGHGLMDQIYEDIKDSYIDRTLKRGDTYPVNGLLDIKDIVVVVSGRAGMGKSALLTHLSLNTKLVNPLPWIVRVNLLDHEKEFLRWQEEGISIEEINVTFVLLFLCKIALKHVGSQTNIKLKYYEGDISIALLDEDIDPVVLFELELFLYLYNSGMVIFLFDDFSAICPHYEKEVAQLLKLLKNDGKRMWITTSSYKHMTKILEKELEIEPYKLDPLNYNEKRVFLNRFFRTNLRLEQLNYAQFENVRSFLKFMSKVTNLRLKNNPDREVVCLFSLVIHIMYVMAVRFFKSEINRASSSTIRSKFKENFEIDLDQYSQVDEILGRTPDDEELELAGTPLHLYIAANYFKFRIEDSLSCTLSEEEARNKWDFILNMFTLYRHYIESHMKRIFFKVDTDDESVISTFRQTRTEFFNKHKKLGLFTICRENDLSKLLKPEEISDIQNTISRIHSGEDRSSLVSCVVNEVPRFAHLVFAEYFAVECLTDIIKAVAEDSDHNPFKNAPIWQSILNVLLFNASPGVRKAFDYKLQSDEELAKLTKSEVCQKMVFELLLKNRRETDGRDGGDTPVTEAFEEGFVNIVNLFISSAQAHLNRGNIDEIKKLLGHSRDKFIEFGHEYMATIKNLMDSIMDMNVDNLADILKSGRLTEVPLRHASDFCTSETASELQRHVAATTPQIQALTANLQQLLQQTNNIGETINSLAELGVKTVLNDLLTRLTQPPPDLD